MNSMEKIMTDVLKMNFINVDFKYQTMAIDIVNDTVQALSDKFSEIGTLFF